jgi:hypothetical protein
MSGITTMSFRKEPLPPYGKLWRLEESGFHHRTLSIPESTAGRSHGSRPSSVKKLALGMTFINRRPLVSFNELSSWLAPALFRDIAMDSVD